MLGDKSFYDIFTQGKGKTFSNSSIEFKQQLLAELKEMYELGGCFEDEGFITTSCEGERLIIKPMIWFRSREECKTLMKMCEA